MIIQKDILALGIDSTQGLKHNLTAEKTCSINFAVTKKKLCLSLHYNGANSCLFVNNTEIYKFKSCLGNISKNWSTDNMKKQILMDISMILV